ncbi:MAG TPA: protein translocase subunit SecD, partial [Mycobacterium sp.]|nr:protein translocase subunit SecD [Mycobacterium sp.]
MASPSAPVHPSRYLAVFLVLLIGVYLLVFLTGNKHADAKLGIDLQGGTRVTLTARTPDGSRPSREALSQAQQIISARVNGLGVSGSEVIVDGDNLVITVPGTDGNEARNLGQTARLYIRPVINALPVDSAGMQGGPGLPAPRGGLPNGGAPGGPAPGGQPGLPAPGGQPGAPAPAPGSAPSPGHGPALPPGTGPGGAPEPGDLPLLPDQPLVPPQPRPYPQDAPSPAPTPPSPAPAPSTARPTPPGPAPSNAPAPSTAAGAPEAPLLPPIQPGPPDPRKDLAERIAKEREWRQSTNKGVQVLALQYEATRCFQEDILAGNDDPDLPLVTCDTQHKQAYLLAPSIISGDQIENASSGMDQHSGGYIVDLQFRSGAANTWADFTAAHIGTQTAFTLDSQVVSAP